jgi:hypothetical protein
MRFPSPRIRPTRRHAGVLLAAPALLLAAVVGSSSSSVAATSTTQTFTPGVVSFASSEIANTMRGQYAWSGQDPQPSSYRTLDTYYRDQVMWNQIEPTSGSYDFTWFDRGLADAGARGGKFGFRVMAWCPGCWRDATPTWLPKQAGTDIPDWNSKGFQDSWKALMQAISDRYGNDPRLGWVDVGGYGKYGEWHTDGEGTGATKASTLGIITSVFDAFPKQHVVINAMNQQGVDQAMALSPRIGLRADCLGAYRMYSMIPTSTALQQRWKTAPVMTEWCHSPSASTVTGADQVRKYHISTVSSGNTWTPYTSMSATQQAGWRSAVKHSGYRYQLRSLTLPRSIRSGTGFAVKTWFKNAGSAPTYDAWRVELRLLDADNHVVSSTGMGVDLTRLLGGWKSYARTLSLTAAPGTYRLAVAVVDPAGYLAPMTLASKGRVAGGSYYLGTVKVTG